ncbi:hypothetical protein [Methylosinus sp. LW4]|uniref:hypothetical protein n=1 Tax=Methylosinus sp. LW4 TaxID=136993 RepID=UPI000367A334|nr:hypothetical protein [Methylosinus sp. LW4]
MSIRLVSYAAVGALAVGLAVAAAGEAKAQANVLKECGTQYQAAKAANELKGQSWQDFLKACRVRLSEQPAETAPAAAAPAPTPAPAPAAAAPEPTPAPAPAPAPTTTTATPAPAPAPTTAAKPAKPVSEGKAAQAARQKKCGAEWKSKKAELLKADPKATWPKYWSECNKRLKAAGE